MTTANTKKLALTYEGSVKHVWEAPDAPDNLWFEFSDDYSVFDWGKMPDTIDNKGRALALIGAFFFERLHEPSFWQKLSSSVNLKKFDSKFLARRFESSVFAGAGGLSKAGLRTHFKGLTDEVGSRLSLTDASRRNDRILMQVERAQILRPQLGEVLEQPVFFYPPQGKIRGTTLIPLEIVFRFGMPAGSSLEQRLSSIPNYARVLGFKSEPKPNQWFEFPVLEFFTKLEPKDRFLSVQEAAVLSGLTADEFSKMTELALDVALALHEIFGAAGIELWDGKVEMLAHRAADNSPAEIVLADSIGPDELRLLYDGHQLSKEMIRQFYRGTAWEKSLKEAQKLAFERGTTEWKEICVRELNSQPTPLSPEFKSCVSKLYGVLANALIEAEPFPDHPNLTDFGAQIAILKTKNANIGTAKVKT
ncbi:MAG TPA: phosphoribosylaminoimidazolesuccinocarboxamide synthase [Oculatellaceae cyanobacterium]